MAPKTRFAGKTNKEGAPEKKKKNKNREQIGSNNSDSNPPEAAIGSATIDNDAPRTAGEENMAVEPMRPVGFFFKPSDYWTACKLSSRCHQHDFLETIKDFKESEKSWFENHPQFKHLFHMDCCEKRKVQGLWMLLLRCMHTGKERQAWFGVNGVPIRYSIREHALLSGLYCGSYPENYPRKGKMKFATKHFKHLQKKTKEKNRKKQGLRVTEADVLEKLEKMEADDGSDERLKMAVLYFLTRVIRRRTRNAYFIEPFILQAVDDLDFCNKFPWGRYTFDDCMKEIFHLRDHFAKGLPENNMQWTFPGFVIPLEILAFECIPVLRESFRDPDPNCLPDCPRMCKWKYKRTGTTGFALEEIYKALGNTKVISSTLKPQGDELDLLYEIMDEGSVEDVELQDDSDKADIAVDGWNRILIEPEGKIFWEDLFEMDVRTRPTTQQQSEPHGIFEGQEEERVCEEPEAGGEAGRESVKELELRLNKRMDDGFALRDETIRLLAARVKELEQDRIQRENWSFQFGEYETCEASGGKGRDNMGNGNEDGEAVAEKDGEKQVEEEAEKDGAKELISSPYARHHHQQDVTAASNGLSLTKGSPPTSSVSRRQLEAPLPDTVSTSSTKTSASTTTTAGLCTNYDLLRLISSHRISSPTSSPRSPSQTSQTQLSSDLGRTLLRDTITTTGSDSHILILTKSLPPAVQALDRPAANAILVGSAWTCYVRLLQPEIKFRV
ncbi:PREDICTED: uncharacterized protein At3g43530-like [Brassica oleracea var. oleracea]|nr:PREDICTED: uncharacterized protein At3g43530-like [Brassica oleracea var. oleracea]